MPGVYKVIISSTCRHVSKTYSVFVIFSDLASAEKVLTVSFRYQQILHIIWVC